MIQNQVITMKNNKTGGHRTFAVKVCQKGGLEGKQIVALLTGQDNENDYQGFGFVTDTGIKVWRSKDTETFRVYAAMLEQFLGLCNRGFAFNDVEFLASKRCIRCNRTLTTPESIELGIGPECARRM